MSLCPSTLPYVALGLFFYKQLLCYGTVMASWSDPSSLPSGRVCAWDSLMAVSWTEWTHRIP